MEVHRRLVAELVVFLGWAGGKAKGWAPVLIPTAAWHSKPGGAGPQPALKIQDYPEQTHYKLSQER